MCDYTNPHEGTVMSVCGSGLIPIIDVAKWGAANGKQLIAEA